jgi:hypothetical protein
LEEIANNNPQVNVWEKSRKLLTPTHMFAESEGTPALLKTADEK